MSSIRRQAAKHTNLTQMMVGKQFLVKNWDTVVHLCTDEQVTGEACQ